MAAVTSQVSAATVQEEEAPDLSAADSAMLNAYNMAGSLLPGFGGAVNSNTEVQGADDTLSNSRRESWRLSPSPPSSSVELARHHLAAEEEKDADSDGRREAGGATPESTDMHMGVAEWEEEQETRSGGIHLVSAPPGAPPGARPFGELHAHRKPLYHPLTKINHKRGYWGSLSIEQEDRLRSFAERIAVNGHEKGVRAVYARSLDAAEGAFGNAYERLLLRFLRARTFNSDEALDLLLEDVEWRREEAVEELARMSPSDVLQTTRLDELWSTGHQSWFAGFDEQERPVIFAKYGETEIWKSKEIVSLDNLLRMHVWEQEQASILCETRSSETGYLIETFVMVLDLQGMSIRQVTRDFLMLVKSSASLDQAHYPERLGQIYVINTPMMFGTVWSGIRPWLSAETQEKIHVLPTPQQWQPVLLQLLGPRQLTPPYGGSARMAAPWLLRNMTARDYMDRPGRRAEHWSDQEGDVESELTDLESERVTAVSTETDSPPSASGLAKRKKGLKQHDDPVRYGPAVAKKRGRGEDRSRRYGSPSKLDKGFELAGFEMGSGEDWEAALDDEFDDDMVDTEACVANPNPMPMLRRTRRKLSFQHSSTRRLIWIVDNGNILLMFAAVAALSFAGFILGNTEWTPEVDSIIWTSMVICTVATFLLIAGFMGLMANRLKNVLAMRFYITSATVVAVLLFAVAVGCLIVAVGQRGIVESVNVSKDLVDKIEEYNRSLGILSICLCIVLVIISRAARSLAAKLRLRGVEPEDLREVERQMCSVLWLSNLVSLAFALVSIVYGGVSSAFAVDWQLREIVFTEFLLVASGAGIVITSFSGLWAVRSKSRYRTSVLRINMVLLCVLLFLLSVAATLSFEGIGQVKQRVKQLSSELDLSEKKVTMLTVHVQKSLLISGFIELQIAIFQLVNLFVIHVLVRKLQSNGRDSRSHWSSLTMTEKMIAVWAGFSGFINVFLDGTYAVMNKVILRESRSWFTWVWRIWAHVDARFASGDPLIVAINAVKALISGPLSLIYCWAVYTRRPNRFTLGILVCAIQTYSVCLYFASEAANKFRDIGSHSTQDNALLTIIFVLVNVFRFVTPVAILIHDGKAVLKAVRISHNAHLLNMISRKLGTSHRWDDSDGEYLLGSSSPTEDDFMFDVELEDGMGGGDARHRGRHIGLSRGIRGMGHGYWDHGLSSPFDEDESDGKHEGPDGEVDLHRDLDAEEGDGEEEEDQENREAAPLIFRGKRQRRRSLSF